MKPNVALVWFGCAVTLLTGFSLCAKLVAKSISNKPQSTQFACCCTGKTCVTMSTDSKKKKKKKNAAICFATSKGTLLFVKLSYMYDEFVYTSPHFL